MVLRLVIYFFRLVALLFIVLLIILFAPPLYHHFIAKEIVKDDGIVFCAHPEEDQKQRFTMDLFKSNICLLILIKSRE